VPRLPPRSGDIIVAGGGWDVSDGVKRAVQEAVAAYGLELHVERGTCWTFSRRLVHRSLNSSASLAKVSDTSRTKELQVGVPCLRPSSPQCCTCSACLLCQVEVKETPTSWATKINAILAAGDDVDALRRIMGKHGREKLEDGTYVSTGCIPRSCPLRSFSTAVYIVHGMCDGECPGGCPPVRIVGLTRPK
jgi:hypothetical protein